MNKNIVELSEEFLELSERFESEDEEGKSLEELKEERKKWEERLSDKGEDDPLYEMGKEKLDDLAEKIENYENSKERYNQVRQNLLEKISSEFAPKDEWIETEVIRALSKILIGAERETIYINEREVNEEYSGGVEEIFDIAEAIRLLAEDKLGETDELENFWNKIKSQKRAKPLRIVAESNNYIKRKDIAEDLDEMDAQQVGNNVRSIIHKTDYNLYHRTEDGYGLSFLGEYLKKNYMIEGNSKKKEEDKENTHREKEEKSKENSGQKSIEQEEFFNDVSE